MVPADKKKNVNLILKIALLFQSNASCSGAKAYCVSNCGIGFLSNSLCNCKVSFFRQSIELDNSVQSRKRHKCRALTSNRENTPRNTTGSTMTSGHFPRKAELLAATEPMTLPKPFQLKLTVSLNRPKGVQRENYTFALRA